ncbi:MAG: hypothetical protein GX162_06940 [Firmicutes bacterium]|nr:hypothetical protein [Bacillota bacterium]
MRSVQATLSVDADNLGRHRIETLPDVLAIKRERITENEGRLKADYLPHFSSRSVDFYQGCRT